MLNLKLKKLSQYVAVSFQQAIRSSENPSFEITGRCAEEAPLGGCRGSHGCGDAGLPGAGGASDGDGETWNILGLKSFSPEPPKGCFLKGFSLIKPTKKPSFGGAG